MEFKIYPFKKNKDTWDKGCWWTIKILSSQKELRKQTVKKKCHSCPGILGGTGDCLGLTHLHCTKERIDTYGNICRKSLKGEVGSIYLIKDQLDSGVVSHECCHATMFTISLYTHVINFMSPLYGEADEQIAQILGGLVNQIYINLGEK